MGWPYVVLGIVFVLAIGGFLVLTGFQGGPLTHKAHHRHADPPPRRH